MLNESLILFCECTLFVLQKVVGLVGNFMRRRFSLSPSFSFLPPHPFFIIFLVSSIQLALAMGASDKACIVHLGV